MFAGSAIAGSASAPVIAMVKSPIPRVLFVVIGCLPVLRRQWHGCFDCSQNSEVKIEVKSNQSNDKQE
jgi:hypothetical protein